ncbi:hypothetical protein GUJ93_ZPchr0013g35185 [Zizania palustris]|uniref:Uncharacterized protein n=1 Tax=Zizania palustris TaxID=103762 RepID=A0A8J6BVU7_ZIZPA|nr:hypothetical protein GUJ93_ZPchr0013g35185 [Zizania palustris]
MPPLSDSRCHCRSRNHFQASAPRRCPLERRHLHRSRFQSSADTTAAPPPLPGIRPQRRPLERCRLHRFHFQSSTASHSRRHRRSRPHRPLNYHPLVADGAQHTSKQSRRCQKE